MYIPRDSINFEEVLAKLGDLLEKAKQAHEQVAALGAHACLEKMTLLLELVQNQEGFYRIRDQHLAGSGPGRPIISGAQLRDPLYLMLSLAEDVLNLAKSLYLGPEDVAKITNKIDAARSAILSCGYAISGAEERYRQGLKAILTLADSYKYLAKEAWPEMKNLTKSFHQAAHRRLSEAREEQAANQLALDEAQRQLDAVMAPFNKVEVLRHSVYAWIDHLNKLRQQED